MFPLGFSGVRFGLSAYTKGGNGGEVAHAQLESCTANGQTDQFLRKSLRAQDSFIVTQGRRQDMVCSKPLRRPKSGETLNGSAYAGPFCILALINLNRGFQAERLRQLRQPFFDDRTAHPGHIAA